MSAVAVASVVLLPWSTSLAAGRGTSSEHGVEGLTMCYHIHYQQIYAAKEEEPWFSLSLCASCFMHGRQGAKCPFCHHGGGSKPPVVCYSGLVCVLLVGAKRHRNAVKSKTRLNFTQPPGDIDGQQTAIKREAGYHCPLGHSGLFDCSSTFGMLQRPSQTLLPAGSALKVLRSWRLSTCSVCFLIVSFSLKNSCCCFSSGGRGRDSNDTVDSERAVGHKPF